MSRRRRRNRLPQEPVALEIESLNHDGKGVAHHDGKAVFVTGALPGEKVLARYLKVQKRHDEATAVDILTSSPDRISPECSVFGICGGCTMQHLSSANQIQAKQHALLETLKRIGKVAPNDILPPLMNDSAWGYRRKARLGVKYVQKKDKVLVGFRERGSSFITETTSCPVLHPAVGNKLAALSALIKQFSIRDKIPQIEVAIDDENAILIFRILESLSSEDEALLVKFGLEHNFIIYTQSGGPESIKRLNGEPVILSYALPDFDLHYDFLPTDFTQVNTDINRKMIKLAMQLLQTNKNDKVLDLFCGLGNFTLPLASLVKEVVGVEADRDLIERAKQNALSNQLTNTRYYQADLYQSIEQAWIDETFDKILLDPPRSGAFEIVQDIDRFKTDRIVYVSCYPGTLARDLDVFVNNKGFTLESVGVMDMFPHTGHVESIALLTRQ